jgi:hypothetical protein
VEWVDEEGSVGRGEEVVLSRRGEESERSMQSAECRV